MLSFAVFGLMIAFGVSYIGMLGVRLGPPAHRTNISMEVADVNSLVVGSSVLLRGVPVGKITKISNSVTGAVIDFYIGDQFHVPVDSEVRLENLSALGESYIGLLPRVADGPTLHDGQHIATESIRQPASISELATSVVRVLNQLDPEALKRVIGEVDTGLPEANSVLPNLSHTARLLRNTVADLNGNGAEVLDNFQVLLGHASWLGPVLAQFISEMNVLNPTFRLAVSSTVATVDSGGPENVLTFGKYLARIQKLLDNNGGDLKVVGDNFAPHVTGIAGSLMNFDTGQILTNLLDSMPDDGAVTLHVKIPDN